MTESNDASAKDVWEFIAENPRILGFNVTEEKVLDLLGALAGVFYALEEEDIDHAKLMLTSVATALVAGVTGSGDEVVEEIMVAEAMQDFDDSLKGLLNEER